jgi:glycosyltransferase involved in cell wall biosynthesis
LTGVWRPNTGILVYAVQLARELVRLGNGNEYTLFFSGEVHPDFRELEGKFRAVVIPVREEVIGKQVLMAALCNTLRLDLTHFPAFPPPAACFRPFVWTLHDVTPWLYPETMDLKGRLYFRRVGGWAARCSRAVITDSHDSKRRITQLLRVPENKVFVVHGGVNDGFGKLDDQELLNAVRARYRLPERSILTVATLEPRKNLPFLVEAYRRLRTLTGTKLGLVIAGRAGWKLESLQPAFRESRQEIVLTGFVPQRDLVALYNLAEVFVLPSLYEGFGFPPLEAMACGCPVIVSNRGSLPEVVGDAALLIDPENPDSLVAALGSVEANQSLRDDLTRKGFERVKQFSWRTTAVKTLELYREVAG